MNTSIDNVKSESVKHTPAPWRVDSHGSTFDFVHPQIMSGEKRVAAVLWENDARLIAAAPDLLEACKVALAELGKMGCECDPGNQTQFECPICMLTSAISRATNT